MTGKEAAERFWDHALSVYGETEAREAFLRLQDRDGADVPMLLWCLWCASEGIAVSGGTMAEAVAFSRDWRRGVVDPLRALRRGMKGGVAGVPYALAENARGKVAKTEQEVERLQMTHLAGLVTAGGGAAPVSAEAAFALYAKTAGLSLSAEDCAIVLAQG